MTTSDKPNATQDQSTESKKLDVHVEPEARAALKVRTRIRAGSKEKFNR
jgi:hypothetical protein